MESFSLEVGKLYKLKNGCLLDFYEGPDPSHNTVGFILNAEQHFMVIELDVHDGSRCRWIRVCSAGGIGWTLIWSDLRELERSV